MSQIPQYGQRSDSTAAPTCPRHPNRQAIDYCKSCNRPMCSECAVPTEVRSICVDCAGKSRPRIQRQGPVVTYTLIGICVALWLLGFGMRQLGMTPVLDNLFVFSPAYGRVQPWRFLTTAFLHANIGHLAFNMFALYLIGSTVEKALGHWRYLAVYLLSALGGSLMVLAWCFVSPSSFIDQTVGASGAVFGLFAALFVIQRFTGTNTTAILVLLGINLVYGFISPGISWQSHVGGMIVGGLLTWVMVRMAKPKPGITAVKQERRALMMSVGVFLGMVVLAFLMYQGIFALHGG